MTEERLQAIVIGVVAGNDAAGAQVEFENSEDIKIEFFGAVEEDHPNVLGWIR